MKIIKIALMLALFTSGLSVIDAISAQTGESWFAATAIDGDHYNNVDGWQSLQHVTNDESVIDSSFGYLYQYYMLGRAILGVVKSVFYIVPMMEELFNFASLPVQVGTLVGTVLNAGLLIIYGISIYQIIRDASVKSYW